LRKHHPAQQSTLLFSFQTISFQTIIMQLTNFIAVLALTAVGVMAAPGAPPREKPTKPSKPAPPVINQQVVRCPSLFFSLLQF